MTQGFILLDVIVSLLVVSIAAASIWAYILDLTQVSLAAEERLAVAALANGKMAAHETEGAFNLGKFRFTITEARDTPVQAYVLFVLHSETTGRTYRFVSRKDQT